LARAVRERRPATVVITNYTSTGRRFLNLLSLAPLLAASGGRSFMLGRQQEVREPLSVSEVKQRLVTNEHVIKQTVAAVTTTHELIVDGAHRQAQQIARTIKIRTQAFGIV
ncbi:MAG: hypothetical protein MI723_12225, partial [Caulobacterales bacterium]|nr:hypothetical protein [Caulobacterales bacterium]